MITAIPNQPVNFSGSLMYGCVCDPVVPGLLISEGDNILFQLGVGLCADAETIIDPISPALGWKPSGWPLSDGFACAPVSLDNTGIFIENALFLTPGTPYMLTFFVASGFTGSMTVVAGGFSTTITTSGSYEFIFTALSTQQIRFTLDTPSSSACIQAVALYEWPNDIEVRLMQGGIEVFSTDPLTDPDYFTYVDASLTVQIPMADTGVDEGCFTIEVENACDNVTLTSQEIIVTGTECTVKIRACNDEDAMGFYGHFTPEIRLNAKLVHATYEYEVTEERRSNGRIMRPYADRQRLMELRIGLQSEFVHPFIAALPLFDHFYIEQEEFVMDAEGYQPLYEDVFDGTGGIVIPVRPKQELLRKVRCAEERAGCVPPPNLWVQGTGPNNDYILTQTGNRFLLNL